MEAFISETETCMIQFIKQALREESRSGNISDQTLSLLLHARNELPEESQLWEEMGALFDAIQLTEDGRYLLT